MSKEILLNKLEKQFSYYELVDEMQETINYSKIVDFLENEKDQKISYLEAKLAESEHRNKQLVDALNGEVFINYKLPMENAQLKQQLAEKDLKIIELETKLNLKDKGTNV